MSGILDSKSRIIDAIITLEGRRQLSDGKLKIEYASFTDATTFYKGDITSGSADATTRVYLEACHLPQDQIVFEADDSGKLVPRVTGTEASLKSGQLLQTTFAPTTAFAITGSFDTETTLSGEAFASEITGILTSSIDNLQKLYTIGTNDVLLDDPGFAIGPSTLTFAINNEQPIKDTSKWTANVNRLESLFNDPRMSNVKNFKYLPPTVHSKGTKTNRSLGHYQPAGGTKWWNNPRAAYVALRQELRTYEQMGYCKSVHIDPTTRENNLLSQFFEISHDNVRKLDVIDYGTFSTGNSSAPVARVFFAGRVLTDDNGTHTFVHLFTLIFE